MPQRLGGHALVEQLLECGANRAFCVPGESYLAVLDGFYAAGEQIELVTARQEGGAAMMAAAHGKLTGQPGLCFVTRGPGATNASIGVHIARQDAAPMVLFIGQVGSIEAQRMAFQEVDYRLMFADLAKEVLQADRADRLPELVARAWSVAVAGEPGPVVVVLPEDTLSAFTDAPVVPARPPAVPHPSGADVADFVARLDAAQRPLLLVGGSGWTRAGSDGLRRFAEDRGLPVATAVRHQDLMNNTSPSYVGTLGLGTTAGLVQFVDEADLIALIGTRPDALTAQNFDLLKAPRPKQTVLHVHPDAETIHRVYSADLPVVAAPGPFAEALVEHCASRPRSEWAESLRQNYLEEQIPSPLGLDPRPYMKILNASLPEDAILTAGAGQYTSWHQRFHSYTTYPSQVSTQSGSMGYGLPAAIAAQLVQRDRKVVGFAGDGCLLMTGQELATAAQYDARILVVVVNNGSYGTIRMHQEGRFPGRVSGTDLVNPDFAAYAQSFGIAAARVRTPAEFQDVLGELLAAPGPALVEIVDDVDRFAAKGAS